MNKIEVFNLSEYKRPEIKETGSKDYVLNGNKNEFYYDVIAGYQNSTTNAAIIDSYAQMVFGLGLNQDITDKLSKRDQRNIVLDFILFGESAIEVQKKAKKVVKAYHIPKQKVAPNKQEEGEIKWYWFCEDFRQTYKYNPKRFPAFGYGSGNENEIAVIRKYQIGQFYYSNPTYLAALPYIKLEEELANYFVNHIQNGFSAGHIINMNGGEPSGDETAEEVSQKIINKLTGSTNAGKVIVSFNDTKENATTVEAVEISDAHQQYSYLVEVAQDKICIAHKVVSGAILGINKATGFSSNAEQIETAFNETMLSVIQPIQEILLDGFETIFGLSGLEFIPLRKAMNDEAQSSKVAMSKHDHELEANALIELGEEIDEDWEEIDSIQVEEMEKDLEDKLNISAKAFTQLSADGKLELKDFASFWKDKSEQDTSLFKVRYRYQGSSAEESERKFCKQLMKAGKVYRSEDIRLAGDKVVNAGFGPRGADTYDIWLYKGGVNCKHYWERVIYLRKNNEKVSVYQARKMITALEPEERNAARWKENDKRVAQVATEENNFWKLD